MNSGDLSPDCTFVEFASATIKAAKRSFDEEAATVVRNAWKEVGVIPGAATEDSSWMDRVMDMCKPL